WRRPELIPKLKRTRRQAQPTTSQGDDDDESSVDSRFSAESGSRFPLRHDPACADRFRVHERRRGGRGYRVKGLREQRERRLEGGPWLAISARWDGDGWRAVGSQPSHDLRGDRANLRV